MPTLRENEAYLFWCAVKDYRDAQAAVPATRERDEALVQYVGEIESFLFSEVASVRDRAAAFLASLDAAEPVGEVVA